MAYKKSFNPLGVIILTILAVAVIYCLVALIMSSIHGITFTAEISNWFSFLKPAEKTACLITNVR